MTEQLSQYNIFPRVPRFVPRSNIVASNSPGYFLTQQCQVVHMINMQQDIKAKPLTLEQYRKASGIEG